MKLNTQKTIELQYDANVESVGLHFDAKGITAMVYLRESEDPCECDDILLSWEDVLGWCQASSQEDPDCQTIVSKLRELATKLEEWEKAPYNTGYTSTQPVV